MPDSIRKYADETEMNQKIEGKVDNSKVPFSFGIDSDGRYGYIKQGETTITLLNSSLRLGQLT